MFRPSTSFTREFAYETFRVPEGATLVEGERAADDRHLVESSSVGATIERVIDATREQVTIVHSDASTSLMSLFDQSAIRGWLGGLASPIYIDITSLSFTTWAPILRASVGLGRNVRFLYVEPVSYTRSGVAFNLSDETAGIAALPGFARLGVYDDSVGGFIPLLGFEGARFARLIEQLEPPLEAVFPIIGVPGYKIEFPFYAYEGNRRVLEDDFLYTHVQYARANCPFDAYDVMVELHDGLHKARTQVAPIGTKPHALAAALLALARPDSIEIVYDHPLKAARPTSGASRVCVYFVSEFLASERYKESVDAAAD